ncbi:phage tail protein [Stutzerimonas stutzeri]|uniref:phage tail protein n=1 Tax=Stutzerimonas stutzeri TaxID=316 RepID=UPI00265B618E|nr:phage tail protein [Stutzerimonas stutzeri]MCF6782589.1 phage tail protein [Stutzerimonas stutzeri]MCF6805694.1 phage tail protein [Stutzerimonas stutzeri]
MRYYSKQTGCTYLSGHHDRMPADAIPITEDRYRETIGNPAPGKIRSHDADGLPILIDPPPYVPTSDELCDRIDSFADTARARVAGDPLRAVEYDRARIAAEQFAAAGYQGTVPPMVAAWAINGRTAQEAADDILREAAQYTAALIALRETRLAAKEQVRALMDAGEVEQAQQVVEHTVAAIEASVAGVGNAA